MRTIFLLACWPLMAVAQQANNTHTQLQTSARGVKAPILFNTPEADAVVGTLQIMPRDNPWNEDISKRPVLPNSDAMIARIAADLTPNRRTLRLFQEMNYVLVPDDQPLVPIRFVNYPDESDLNGGKSPVGLYPIPPDLPVETWPAGTGSLTLEEWQQDKANAGGDRHAIIVQPGTGKFWETWETKRVGNSWQASNGAQFSLTSNATRPNGWTSGDAAGLPMFPALVRYDECQRGEIRHAMRLVVKRTRVGPIYPATHSASVGKTTDPDILAMGQRLRLKAGFAIPPAWSPQEKAVLAALKKFGALVADNGGFFSISITPDKRFPKGCFDHLSTVGIGEFEVIQTTGQVGAEAKETRDLILVAGQSNAVGFDAIPSQLSVDPSDKNVLFWWRCGDPPPDEHDSMSHGWGPLQPQPRGNPMPPNGKTRQYGNFHNPQGGFGPEIGFARTLQAKDKRPLAIVKVAFNGTGMTTDWNPRDAGPGGACYRMLLEETRKAVADAAAKGIDLNLRALVWVQGESDADAKNAPEYAKNLGQMIQSLRTDLKAPELIALLGVNSHFGDKNPFISVVVEQQKALAAHLPHCAHVDSSGLTYANAAHFDTKSTIELGRRFAEAFLQKE